MRNLVMPPLDPHRILLALAVLAPAAIAIIACDDVGRAYGSAPDTVDAGGPDRVPDLDAGGDLVGDLEGPINATAGSGAYALRGATQPDGGVAIGPLRVDPSDDEIHPLACPQVVNEDTVDLLGVGMRVFHEPNAPEQAKFVYPVMGRGLENDLVLVRHDSTCGQEAPRSLTAGVTGSKLSPSFSDDGKRVAFIAATGSTADRLVTAATDGPLDPFEIRNVAGTKVRIGAAPPIWIRDAEGVKVAWVEVDDQRARVVRVALDRSLVGGTPRSLLNCGEIFRDIVQIGLFRGVGGKVHLAFTAQLNDPDAGNSSQRGIFSVDYKRACDTRTLLFDDQPASFSSDFAIAPDGERMAHVANRTLAPNGGVDQKRIWIGSISTRTRKVCSRPPAEDTDLAPQWLADGTQLAWTRRARSGGATVMIADVTGDGCTNERVLAPSRGDEVAFTASNGCSIGRRSASVGIEGALLFGALFLARLRRKRS